VAGGRTQRQLLAFYHPLSPFLMQILQIVASAQGANSYSTRLSQGIIDKLLAAQPGSTVVVRDLAQHPFPYLKEAHLQAYFTPAENRTPTQQYH